MKKVFLLIVSILLSLNALAQLEVKSGSFKEVPGFVNINHDENYQYDDNNLPFAVVKVRTENITDKQRRELRFESNMATGIVLEYHTGEVWVYLTAKYADYLKISHTDFSSIEFTLPFDLMPKHGYEMTLVNKTAPAASGSGSLTVNTVPENGATIKLNGKILSQKTPYINDMISAGQYEITVSKERYQTVTETVNIADGDNKKLDITLPIDVATIKITVDDETDIYVDGGLMKRGTWSGELYSGSHDVVCKKGKHYDAKQTIVVEPGVARTYNIQPNPISGTLNVTTTPAGATVCIDNKECGVTPLTLNVIIGQHDLKIKMDNWSTLKKQFNMDEGAVVSFNETLENLPDGAIKGAFSTSPTTKVYFSKGNLQYQASTKTWRFAEHQWEYVGEGNTQTSSWYTGWIDLFAWGTGKEPTKTISIHDGGKYETFDDWGDNNISNTNGTGWRTITQDEICYILGERTTNSGVRFVKALVNEVAGVILLPDDWDVTLYKLKKINDGESKFSTNKISASDWYKVFEANGAVFLPAAGERWPYSAFSKGIQYRDSNTFGYYLTSTKNEDDRRVYGFYFYEKSLYYGKRAELYRELGYSVRLIWSNE